MARLTIKCPRCRGAMWTEDLPDSKSIVDLACIVCGLRKFYPRARYMGWLKKMEKKHVNSSANKRRTLPT